MMIKEIAAKPLQDDYMEGLSKRLVVVASSVGGKNKLAQMAGISVVQLFRYISGKNVPSVRTIMEISSVAKVDPAWLFAGQGDMNSCDPERLRNVGENLNALSIYGWPSGRIAKLSGLPEDKINGYINGSTLPSIDSLIKISESTPISIDFLLTGKVSPRQNLPIEDNEHSLPQKDTFGAQATSDFVEIEPFDKQSNEKPSSCPIMFSIHYIKNRLGYLPSDLVLAKVRDNAMDPALKNGDLALVDIRNKGKFSGDGIYLVSNHGMATFRRIQLLMDDEIRVVFENSRDYPEEKKSKLSDIGTDKPINIIGKVVWRGLE